MVLHAVGPGALAESYKLARKRAISGYVHAFSGSADQAFKWIDLGWRLSVGGPLLNPQSSRLASWVRAVPLESIVLESDSPDLPPQGVERSTPALVSQVCAKVAELKGLSASEVAEATWSNALSSLGASI